MSLSNSYFIHSAGRREREEGCQGGVAFGGIDSYHASALAIH